MSEYINGKSAYQVAAMLVKHDPDTSNELIADVVSEWGYLMDAGREADAESTIDEE
jgi:hypothetical protein